MRRPATRLALALGLALLAASPGAIGAAAAGSASRIERRVLYYEITGSTAAGLRAALDQAGPVDDAGRRWDGYTAWHLRWQPLTRMSDGACVLEHVGTLLWIDVTLPRWQPPADADPGLERQWRRYLGALQAHEAGHEKIVRDAAAALRKAIERLREAPDCDSFRRAADAAADRVLARFRAREQEYDRRSRHGARQGAHFP